MIITELKEIPWEKRIREIAFYRIDEISFEDKAPRSGGLTAWGYDNICPVFPGTFGRTECHKVLKVFT